MILTDLQIRLAIASVIDKPVYEGGCFLKDYARAVLAADHANFYILRPVSLVLIQKYHLADARAGTTEVTEHTFPSTRIRKENTR
jgi:hypothetical protein